MKKIAFKTLLVLVILLAAFITYITAAWNKTFDAPLPAFKASHDSAVIARGKYLAYGPAHCASCHIPMEKIPDMKKGAYIPLSGGWELPIAPGTFRAPNLTPDPETGIGNMSDAQIARALRYSVNHEGKLIFPFMPFQEMSDEDIVAVISFLRSQPAVKHVVQRGEYTFLGKALLALNVLTPVAPKNTPPALVERTATAKYGAYIANSVANCVGCHTERDLKTGAFTGAPFAGGFKMEHDVFSQGYSFVTPNLTPDKETGLMAEWNEQTFINRFKNGRIHAGSHMPWESFAKMDTLELKALYAYLTSLPPVRNQISKIVYAPGEKLPE